eukprot:11409293-Karenia_brevis.AAC.1
MVSRLIDGPGSKIRRQQLPQLAILRILYQRSNAILGCRVKLSHLIHPPFGGVSDSSMACWNP